MNRSGQWKLENIFKDALRVTSRTVLRTPNKIEITKVKGFKNHIKYKQLKSLLSKNKSLLLDQEKWFKSTGKGNISIKKKNSRRAKPHLLKIKDN